MKTLSVPDLLAVLESRDVRLAADGGQLRYSAAAGALTAEIRVALTERRNEILEYLREHGHDSVVPSFDRAPREGDLPLSSAQQRLWFLDRYEPGGTTYNIPAIFDLRGPLDAGALEWSLTEVVARHESLRSVFPERDGEPLQRILAAAPVVLVRESLEHYAEPDREAAARVEAAAAAPFDLAAGPLVRASIFRTAEHHHVLVIVIHHIACDGWSLGVLCRELGALYGARLAGLPSPLPPLRIQYVDYAVWQRRWLQGSVLARQLEYWRARLDHNLPVLQLPSDRPRPSVQTYRGRNSLALLPNALADALRTMSRREGATLFMTLLAALKILLLRYTAQEDLVVGSPIANRTREETEGLIGFLVNTLVLRTDLSGDPSFAESLARVRATALEAYEHQDLPFEKLVEELQPARSVSYSPLFQVLFVLQNAPLQPLQLQGLEPSALRYPEGVAKFDLTLFAEESPDGILVTAEYNTDLFDEPTIRRLLAHYRQLLEAAVANPRQQISKLQLLPAAEHDELVNVWNSTDRSFVEHRTIHRQFEAQVAATPNAIAVEFGETRWTYGELNIRANQLARRLRTMGVGPETRVGICLHRSLHMVVAVLGVLKAGGAYVALDPAYPPERLAYMAADADVAVLLTTRAAVRVVPAISAALLELDSDCTLLSEEDGTNLEPTTGPNSLVYVTYTSGSTGKPKGIAMVQRPLLNLLQWMLRTTTLPRQARTLQFASLSFDVSFQDMFSTWLSGGTLVLMSEAARKDLGGLAQFLAEKRIQRLFIPAVALQQLAEGFKTNPGLRAPLLKVIAGSEQLMISDALVDMFRRHPDCRLHNEYGPSETHVVTELALPRNPAKWPARPPIGRPIDNTQIYILDRAMQPVPVGVPGEVFIGGVGLARGYLGKPELTDERFVPDPFGQPGGRLYKTGDLARYLPTGVIEFLGRLDHQTKIRGYRVEPGEIEAALKEHPSIGETVVVPWAYAPGDQRMVAYVAVTGQRPTTSALRAHLMLRLPEYMVPAAFVLLDALPLTANGKVDRRALPTPEMSRPSLDVPFANPETDLECTIAEVWRDLLGLDRVGSHDNFFDLGGHSLLVVRLQSRLSAVLQQQIPVLDLFKFPTVRSLATHLAGKTAKSVNFDRIDRRARRQRGAYPGGRASSRASFQRARNRGAVTE